MSVQQWITPLQGLESLQRTQAPMPSPAAGEVLVEILAVSLNYRDVEGMLLLRMTGFIADRPHSHEGRIQPP